MRTINASEFKARCLAILDQVSAGGEPITILKRGRPVAQLTAHVPREKGDPQDSLRGTIEILGEVLTPVLPPDLWEAESSE